MPEWAQMYFYSTLHSGKVVHINISSGTYRKKRKLIQKDSKKYPSFVLPHYWSNLSGREEKG